MLSIIIKKIIIFLLGKISMIRYLASYFVNRNLTRGKYFKDVFKINGYSPLVDGLIS